jgi:hypothetical protein
LAERKEGLTRGLAIEEKVMFLEAYGSRSWQRILFPKVNAKIFIVA